MKIFLTFVKILVFLVALFVLTQNNGQYVDITIFNSTFTGVNLLAVILITLTSGAVVGGIFMAFLVLQAKSEIKELRKKNRQLLTELESLRNMSIDEIPEEGDLPQISAPEPNPKNELKGALDG